MYLHENEAELAQMVEATAAAFRDLMQRVGLERRNSALSCPSAGKGIVLAEVLREIVDDEAYRVGYESTTLKLLNLGENVPYDIAIESTKKIIDFLESEHQAG